MIEHARNLGHGEAVPATQAVGNLAFAAASVPGQLAEVAGDFMGTVGDTIASATHSQLVGTAGEIVAGGTAAGTASAIAGLALAGGTPNKSRH